MELSDGLFFSLDASEKDLQINELVVNNVKQFFNELSSDAVNGSSIMLVTSFLNLDEIERGIILIDVYLDLYQDFVSYYFAKLIYENVANLKFYEETKALVREVCLSHSKRLRQEVSNKQLYEKHDV